MTRNLLIAFTLALLLTPAAPVSDRWPQFRGSDAMGVADDPSIPSTWSKTENVVWKTPVPGMDGLHRLFGEIAFS